MALSALIGLGSACSSPPRPSTTTSTAPSSTTTPPATTTTRGSSPPLAAGTSVPGYEVGALSFVSPSAGYGLVVTGGSTAQQLVVTDDGGVTWQVATPALLPAEASTLAFTDADDGYAWGLQGLDVTHDGGRDWQMSVGVSTGTLSVSPIGLNVWAVSSVAGLQTSNDGGASWQTGVQPPLSNMSALSRVTTSEAYVLGCSATLVDGSQPGELARTEDGGRIWQVVALALPEPPACDGGRSDLVALSTDDLWLVDFGEPATDMSSKWVYRSDDGGAHWTLMASVDLGANDAGTGHIMAMGDFGPLSVLAAQPSRAWLAEDRGGLLVTTDGGLTWRPAYDDPDVDANGPPDVSFLDATDGWAATGDGLWRTTDGVTWTEIAPRP
ncbi:MAG: WD40/YVTN/BNR-like repeat-containing protein [Acidimicrobiales bacterium]